MIIFRKYIYSLMLKSLLIISYQAINAQSPVLKHSYTFDEGTPTDIISGANGKIHGGATISNGSFVTSGNGQYLELPADKINLNTYQSFSIETFLVAGKDNAYFTMLVYFGNIAGTMGNDYLYLSLLHSGKSKAVITCKNNTAPWETETTVQSLALTDGKAHHLVTTFDNNELKFYLDGVLTGTSNNKEYQNNIIANIGNDYAFLCRGGYEADPSWRGSIDKFNIYEGVLDSATIARSAKKYLPNLDLSNMAALLKNPSRFVAIDNSGTFKIPITGEQILFTELMPMESDNNNRIVEYLVLSDSSVNKWDKFSIIVRLSSISGYLDILNGNTFSYDEKTKLAVDIGQVYQCWIHVNVKTNTYSLYSKTVNQKNPVLILKDAAFGKKVTELNHWSVVHNMEGENDAMALNVLSEVKNIGDYPKDYKATAFMQKKSVFEEETPAGALVIDNPKHGYRAGNLDLKKIVLTDKQTSLYLRVYHSNTSWILIPDKTYIQPKGSEKMFITGTKGIPMSTNYYASAKGYSDIQLIFPAIDRNTSSFEYGEANEGGSWFIYDILLESWKSDESNVLYGNWFNTTTGDWEFSLLDSLAIYKCNRWFYTGFEPDKKKGDIVLFRGNMSVILYYKRKGDKLYIGESMDKLHVLDQNSRYNTVPAPSNPLAFEKPLLKSDTAEFSGYYYGYSPKMGSSTGTIYVNNVLTGDQENHLVKISSNGAFSVKIPITYPHEVYVQMDQGYTRLFLEPGKKVFVMINLTERSDPLIMGANARLMTEIMDQNLSGFYMNRFYNEIRNKILDMTPEEFKNFCMLKKDEDLKKLDQLYEAGKISDRYYQVKKASIICSYTRDVLHYHYSSQSAYREKYDIPNNQSTLPVKFELPQEPGFYDFIDPIFINDELSFVGNPFDNLINAFKYSPILRVSYSTLDLYKSLIEKNMVREEDKILLNEYLKYNSEEFNDKLNDFFGKYGSIERDLMKTYSKKFEEIEKNKKEDELSIVQLIKHISVSDTISDEYREYCKSALELYSDPIVYNALQFRVKHSNEIREIYDSYSMYMDLLMMLNRNKVLEEKLGMKSGLFTDICNSQDILRDVVSQLTPLSSEMIEQSKQIISYPFIQDYIKSSNDATLATIEANKAKGGYNVNKVPETEADKLFEAIVSKYKGKVIYIDFWATWCGPCRSSMQMQKPMKESFKGKDIVFVYITNPTSPENTYNNMIPNIHGEHYRVSQDEWNYLTSKFNISGIPHYVIVNKKGEVVDANAPRSPSVLTAKFEELLKE